MNTDVLVIGAGPAGSVAGSLLAQKGHRVTCLEAGTFPRFQIGESLLPRCNDLLEEAGLLKAVVARGYQPKNAALFLQGDARERFCFAEVFPGQRTQTFQVPRFDFDQTLATAARGYGVDLRFNQRVDAVEFQPGGGAVIRSTDLESNATEQIQARFVIDCSGYGRVLPKLLNLEKPSSLAPRIALFTWVEGDRRPEGAEEGDIWVCLHPRGAWIWIIPFSNGRTSVGVVMERALYDSVSGCDRDRLMSLLREDPNARARLANAVPVLKTMKLEAWSSAVESLHGPGWALTGNAAEFLDPVFSSGVTVALESASRAAALVHRTLQGETVDWNTEYGAVVEKAVGVFRVFVRTWYTGELPRVLLHPNKTQAIKRAITAILGGYVLDPENPFVRNPEGTLSALLKLS
ncbi:FAD-dependent oxidoreductase [Corallococcus sp. H22C18031201]|uniref:NAD(P)/FAD-dependent oxidoreductase n=1 Tax=Citreicoccus inhibens TaxID=2849499 RepID=UPI000E732A8D|nr:NAD(P)/FAD-dependent oxidoreductase [Citreicoccus inhibens]MBU8895218.1 tryptophan 7-halogenase [Citreicoccus inhibens]RJS27351.1 FAD-dependent oxidoreductase [Corallococcus sp. H22C18031201]